MQQGDSSGAHHRGLRSPPPLDRPASIRGNTVIKPGGESMGIRDTLGHALLDNEKLNFGTEESLTAEERWLVTLSAPLSAFNGDHVNALATGKDDEALREGISEVWNVHDRESFEQMAHWLAAEGQRSSYLSTWQAVGAIDAATQSTPAVLRLVMEACFPAFFQIKARKSLDYRALSADSGRPVSELSQLTMGSQSWVNALRKHFNVSPPQISNLVAWDAVRLASLSRWAVQLGFIGREEFTSFAGALNSQVREAYADWSQVSAAYIAAGLVWRYSDAREEHLLRTNRMLLSDPRSPYRSVPFR
ncbi:DUF1266 domain-containing protein [Variovorax paradoxus]|uniref:DUF1266 domain-containing protein n=1 Tax=Variovorax paradoxus TaxID=34073 RepID=UPI0024811114|nr:DUF1266 domain-containing protein [Variovorax paradoxus]WGT62444.1 DUF1266 domain-containing protein [Variovorax paradoxus]